jgi:hypothetical protein
VCVFLFNCRKCDLGVDISKAFSNLNKLTKSNPIKMIFTTFKSA